jgi:hypothetical protein
MPYGGNNLKSSSDVSLESNGTKDDVSLEKTVTGNEACGLDILITRLTSRYRKRSEIIRGRM